MTHNELVTIIAAMFMIEHNARKPGASAEELLKRAYDSAETFVTYCESRHITGRSD